MRILILGIGNLLQSDEGLGVHIVNQIAQNVEIPEDVEVVDGGTAGFDLLPLMKGREKIIIVDALMVDDEPGSVYRFKPEQIRSARTRFSLHDVGIIEIIELLKLLGENPDIEIIGVVPEDITTLNMDITARVRESIPKVIEQIMDAASFN